MGSQCCTPVNAPITHTAGDSQKISAKLTVNIDDGLNGLGYTLTGTSDEKSLTFVSTGNLVSGAAFEIPVTASVPLGKDIRKIFSYVSWSLVVGGCTFDLGNTGPHTIYTTLGTPDLTAPFQASVPNVPRMEIAVRRVAAAITNAGGADDAYTCYPRIVWNVMKSGGVYSLLTTLDDTQAWLLPTTPGGADCASIARFVRNVVMVMGVPGSFDTKPYIAYYATVGNHKRPEEAIEGNLRAIPIKPNDKGAPLAGGLDNSWVLALADRNCQNLSNPQADAGTVGCGPKGLNAFEAAMIYTDAAGKSWYFPAGVTGDPCFDSPNSVVQIFQTLVWVAYTRLDPLKPEETLVVKAVDYSYVRPADVPLCPIMKK